MSKITEIIFKGEKHYITSSFGYREPISTKAGDTSTKHRGTDYGTNGKKIPQYAIEDGKVYAIGTDGAGAKYVKVDYPRINKRFYHWHLDTISVKKGQAVKKYTKLGTTGMTGKATGVHLHLGIIDLKNNTYIDPEVYAKEYTEPKEEQKTTTTSTTASLKYSKGTKIVLNGYLYRDSAGNGKGAKKTNYKGIITIVKKGAAKPYHIDSLGWVAEADIKLQSTTTITTKTMTTTGNVYLRKTASYGNNIITTIPKGAKVTYYSGTGWAKVKYDGKTGYCGYKYLK